MDQVTARRLAPDAWQIYRTVRLAALADSPTAFSSTLAGELRLTEERWRQRLANRGQLLAYVGDEAIGLAGGVGSADGQSAELVSMWVDPAVRGRGVGRLLVDAVIAWGAAEGFPEIRLWVADGNDAAERLYTRCGFRRTGALEPISANDPSRWQFEMVRRPPEESFGRPAVGDIRNRWP